MKLTTRLLFVSLFLGLGSIAKANSLSESGNTIANNDVVTGCSSSQISIDVTFTTVGGPNNTSDTLFLFKGGQAFDTIVKPTFGNSNSFTLDFSSSLNTSESYSAVFNNNNTTTINFSLSTYGNVSVSIPTGSEEVCYNSSATSTVNATPSGGSGNYTYRWLRANNSGMTGSQVIGGETNSSINLSSLGTLLGGDDIYVQAEITDADCGSVQVSSNVFQVITNNQLQVSIPVNSIDVCFGETPGGTVSASVNGGSSSPNYTYTWFEASNSAMTGKTVIAGQTSSTLNLSSLGQQNGGADIYLQVELNESNCSETVLSSETYSLITHEDLVASMASGSQEVCFNGTPISTIIVNASGGQQPANYSYEWLIANNSAMTGATIIAGANSATLDLSTLGPYTGGADRYIKARVSDANCPGLIKTTANTYQIITLEQLQVSIPAGLSEEVCYNDAPTGSISPSASGGSGLANYSYRWLRANNASMTGAVPIAGQTGTSINLSALGTQTGGDDIYVQAELTDGNCSQTALSSNTYHIITDDQLQVSIPNQMVDVCFGSTPSGTVNATVSGGAVNPNFSYTWYQASSASMVGKTAIVGQTTASLNLSSLGQQNGGADIFIQVEVNESNCSDQALSSESYQLVTHEDLSVTMPAGTENVCYNDLAQATITMTATGGQQPANFSYRWLRANNASMTSATAVVGQTNASLNLNSLGALQGGADIYLQGEVMDNDCGTIKTTTNLYHIVTYDQLQVSIPSGLNEEVCYNGTPSGSITLTPTGGSSSANYTYRWLRADNAAMNNATVISSQTANSINLSVLGQQQGGADIFVQAELTDVACSQTTVSSNTYQVITRDQLQISIPTTSTDVCYNTTPSGAVTATITGGALPTNHSYVWYRANNSAMTGKVQIAGQTSASLNLSVLGQQTGGADIFLQAEVTDNTCSQTDLTSETYQLITLEELQVSTAGGTQEVCFNTAASGILTMNPSGGSSASNYTYRWLEANNPAMTGATPITGETSSSLNLANLGNLNGGADVYIQGELSDGPCSDVVTTTNLYHLITYDQLVAATVNDLNGTLTNIQICHNDPLNFDLEVAYSGGDTNDPYTFTWQFSSDASFSIIDSSKAPQNDPVISAAEIGLFTDTTYIRCVVNDNCNVDSISQTFTVNVWDQLEANDARQATSTATNEDICYGRLLADDLELDSRGGDRTGNFQFRWQRADDANFNQIREDFGLSANSQISRNDIDTLQRSAFFRCIIYDDCGDSSISNTFTANVFPEFLPGELALEYNGTTDPDTIRLCYGENLDLIRTSSVQGADGNYTYNLQYRLASDPIGNYQDISLSANEANRFTLSNANVLTSPFAYIVRQEIISNCGAVYTDSVTVKVNPPPYWDYVGNNYGDLFFEPVDPELYDANSQLRLCEGQQNVLVKLNQEEIDQYDYNWSSGNSLPNVPGARTIVSWDVNAANGLQLDIDFSVAGLVCGTSYAQDPSAIALGNSPDEDQLQQINSLLLDSDPDRTAQFFRWAEIDRTTLTWNYRSAWDTARFFDYGTIDTTQYLYVMVASDNPGSACRSYSYYPSNFILNPSTGTEPIGLKDLDLAGNIHLYPNPNNGSFKLSLDEREEIEEVRVYDLRGQELAIDWDPAQKQIQLEDNVRAYLLVKVQTQYQVATFKVLVQ